MPEPACDFCAFRDPSVIVVFAAVFASMAIEARRAARHERALAAQGGVEPADDVYAIMRVAYPAAFIAMIGEALVRGGTPATFWIGAGVFALAKAAKWWAIVTLGPAWTFRVLVVPGRAPIASGPYRYLRHPNYVGVVGELVGVALMTGARLTGPLATLGFGWLIWKRIQVEERMLYSRQN